MHKVRKVMASVTLAMLVFALGASAGWSQDKAAGKNVATTQVQQAKHKGMSAEEKLVRDVYARLMRYQTAAIDELAARTGKASEANDYLTFELADIHTGLIEEISSRSPGELVTGGSGSVLSVKPTHLSTGKGPAHAYYEVQWTTEPQTRSTNEMDTNYPTLGELVAASGNKFTGSDRYTSYEVTARLGGKQRTYRALVLHRQTEAALSSAAEILDNVTSALNTVLRDESPRVRSPWNKYIKTAPYTAVARQIATRIAAGQPLIPADAPIGYLPGDDVSPSAQDQQTLAADAECEPPVAVTVEVSPAEVNPSGIDGVTGTTTTVTVRTNPVSANRAVTLTDEAVTSSGGHVNHSGARPRGTFTQASGTTDANGTYRTTYTSPIFGGTMTVKASIGQNSGSTFLQISMTGLVDLGGDGTHYTLTGQLRWHPSNHYGTETAITNLPLIADDYFAVYPNSAKLEYNDMSLINGGKFDINPDRTVPPNWTNTHHAEHREGKNCDIPYAKTNLISTTQQQQTMEQILRNRQSPNFLKHVAPDPLHYHARFEP
jgi:hypothetical protein